jgi:hypothetical protein
MSSNVFFCESCSINSIKVCATSASISGTCGAALTVVKRPPVVFVLLVGVAFPGVISKMLWSSWQAAIDIWKSDVGWSQDKEQSKTYDLRQESWLVIRKAKGLMSPDLFFCSRCEEM